MATVIERLAVSITANYKGLTKGLRASQRQVERFARNMEKAGRRLTVMGGAMLAPIALSTREFLRFGDSMQKMAIRTGFSTRALSELSFAANIAGADIGAIEKGSRRMSKAILDANDGLTTYVRAFDRIGLSAADLARMSPEDAFMEIGKAIAATEDPITRAAAAQDIFGRAGTSLLPLFEQGADGLERLRQEARDLGISMSDLAANRAAEANDAVTRMKASVQGLALTIGSQLAPYIIALSQKFKDFTANIRGFLEQNKQIIVTYTKLALTILGVGAALLVVAGAAKVLAVLLSPAGIIGVAAAGVLLLLDAAGQVNLGWMDFVNNIRVGGLRIGTWTTGAALIFMQSWNKALAYVSTQWATLQSILSADDGKMTFKSFFHGLTVLATDAIMTILKTFTWVIEKALNLVAKAIELIPGSIGEKQAAGLREWADSAAKAQEDIARDRQNLWADEAAGKPNAARALVDDLDKVTKDLEAKNKPLRDALSDVFIRDIRQGELDRDKPSWLDAMLKGINISANGSVGDGAFASVTRPGALERGTQAAYSAQQRDMATEMRTIAKNTGKAASAADKTAAMLTAGIEVSISGADIEEYDL